MELQSHFTSHPYRVPELVPAATEGDAFLMRSIPGTDLATRLNRLRPWTRPTSLKRTFELVGGWLAKLISVTEVDRSAFRPDELLARARCYLDEARDEGYPAKKIAKLNLSLQTAAAQAVGAPLARCLVHGDFRPSHIFCTAGSVNVLDFEQSANGWAHEDAAYFLAALEVHLARRPLARIDPRIYWWARCFLRAYLTAAGQGWYEVNRFMRLVALVRTLSIECRSDLARNRPTAFQTIVIPHYDRAMRALATRN